MHRPSTQLPRQYTFHQIYSHRRSTDLKDPKSKSKKMSHKNYYKEYIKRLVQNNPNHIDYEKKLKIDKPDKTLDQLYSGRYEQFERKYIYNHDYHNYKEIKSTSNTFCHIKEEQKQKQSFLKTKYVRFLMYKLKEKDFKCFKRLYEIYTKSQRIKQQIYQNKVSSLSMALTTVGSQSVLGNGNQNIKNFNNNNQTGILKQNLSNQNNEKLTQLKQSLLKLQIQEQRILLEIQNQQKQNKFKDKDKVTNKYISQTQEKNKDKQNAIINTNSNAKTGLINSLYELILQLDPHYTKIYRNQRLSDNCQIRENNIFQVQFNQISEFIKTKQRTIDQLFTSLSNLCKIGLPYHHRNSLGMKINENNIICVDQKKQMQEKRSPSKQSSTVLINNDTVSQRSIHFSSQINSISSKKSFKSILFNLEQYLSLLPQIDTLKQRNTQLAKKLLSSTKLLNMKQEEISKCQGKLKQLQNSLQMKIKQKQSLINKINKMQKQSLETNLKHLTKIEQFQQMRQKYSTENRQLHEKLRQNCPKQVIDCEVIKVNREEYCNRELLNYENQVKMLNEQNDRLKEELLKSMNNHNSNDKINDEIHQLQQMKEEGINNIDEDQNSKVNYKQGYCFNLRLNISNDQHLLNKLNKQHLSSTQLTTNNSLIYKQQQKKNKKLNKQLVLLREQVNALKIQLRTTKKELSQQILRLNMQLNESNKAYCLQLQMLNKQKETQIHQKQQLILHTNKISSQEMQSIIQQRQQYRLSYSRLLQDNIKLEEQFQYIVREKLQLQQQNKGVWMKLNRYEQGKMKDFDKFQQLQQAIGQIQQSRKLIKKYILEFRENVQSDLIALGQVVEQVVDRIINKQKEKENSLFINDQYQYEQNKQEQYVQHLHYKQCKIGKISQISIYSKVLDCHLQQIQVKCQRQLQQQQQQLQEQQQYNIKQKPQDNYLQQKETNNIEYCEDSYDWNDQKIDFQQWLNVLDINKQINTDNLIQIINFTQFCTHVMNMDSINDMNKFNKLDKIVQSETRYKKDEQDASFDLRIV